MTDTSRMIDETPENPRAFPAITDEKNVLQWGMTLRDYFAGQALTKLRFQIGDGETITTCVDGMARYCYDFADAMLKARRS